jgi:hypothetical protein
MKIVEQKTNRDKSFQVPDGFAGASEAVFDIREKLLNGFVAGDVNKEN